MWLAAAAALLAAGCTSALDPPRPIQAASPAPPPPHAAAAPYVMPPPPRPRPARIVLKRPGYEAVGMASWYGRRYHGRRTASGERFDMRAATAAHPTLPFGTRVRVTNLGNGRSVIVRINDRGPFVRRRIIDVSRRAAEQLGFIRAGVARVRVQVVQRARADYSAAAALSVR